VRYRTERKSPSGIPSFDSGPASAGGTFFGFHGYSSLVHRLTYRRTNRNLHVRGYKEEGTITTPFDMRVQNDLEDSIW
jgi:phosphoketolase